MNPVHYIEVALTLSSKGVASKHGIYCLWINISSLFEDSTYKCSVTDTKMTTHVVQLLDDLRLKSIRGASRSSSNIEREDESVAIQVLRGQVRMVSCIVAANILRHRRASFVC